MSDYPKHPYKRGDKVIFHDENQLEVKGLVMEVTDHPDFVCVRVELSDGSGFYTAKLRRT